MQFNPDYWLGNLRFFCATNLDTIKNHKGKDWNIKFSLVHFIPVYRHIPKSNVHS